MPVPAQPSNSRHEPSSVVSNFGCYIKAEVNGKIRYYAVSRQMVLFGVERRKAWRMLQSKAGVVNKDYLAQKAFLAKVDKVWSRPGAYADPRGPAPPVGEERAP